MIITQTRWMKVLLLILLSACHESTIRPPEQSHAISAPVLKPRYKEGVVDNDSKGLEHIHPSDGTVIDNQTGLIWLKNANCFGVLTWKRAKQSTANLAHGQCGLQDGSKPGMWRLPTIDELEAIVDKKYKRPALSNAAGTGHWKENDAFSHVQIKRYWSSSPITSRPGAIWSLNLGGGYVVITNQADSHYVWPVRGGN